MDDVNLPPLLLSMLCLFVGLALCFSGYRMFKLVIALAGFALGAFFAGSAAQAMTSSTLLLLLAGFVGGMLGAVLLSAVYLLGVFVVGAYLGFLVGVAIDDMLPRDVGPLLWGGLALVTGIAALAVQKAMIILSTAFVGASLIIVGFTSLFDRSFEPIEFERSSTELIAWIVLGAVGCLVQFRTNQEPPEPRQRRSTPPADPR